MKQPMHKQRKGETEEPPWNGQYKTLFGNLKQSTAIPRPKFWCSSKLQTYGWCTLGSSASSVKRHSETHIIVTTVMYQSKMLNSNLITKTSLFKYIEHYTIKKMKIFR